MLISKNILHMIWMSDLIIYVIKYINTILRRLNEKNINYSA